MVQINFAGSTGVIGIITVEGTTQYKFKGGLAGLVRRNNKDGKPSSDSTKPQLKLIILLRREATSLSQPFQMKR